MDYDSDGDLDTFLANFSGANFVMQSGQADGLPVIEGLFHRTGTTSGGSLAPWFEVPSSGNGGTTLDADCQDMDGDGDPDILLSNDQNQMNRYWENVLGVPDTHAPIINALTVQGDKSDGSDTALHAKVLDNAAHYVIANHDAQLLYTVNGGLETCVPMFAQGSQQFRAVIPGGLSGVIAYRVEVTDGAGNTGLSATLSYNQTGGTAPTWQRLDCGTSGFLGTPSLTFSGTQIAGQPVTMNLADGAPNAFALLFASLASTPLPFKGGLLHTVPIAVELTLTTDPAGQVVLTALWPSGLPMGTQHWWQAAIQDASNPNGATLTNAVIGTQP
ncbi:MAG: hypothetical protein ACI9EF_003014 [Pseudohongiellaceae bacterium]